MYTVKRLVFVLGDTTQLKFLNETEQTNKSERKYEQVQQLSLNKPCLIKICIIQTMNKLLY